MKIENIVMFICNINYFWKEFAVPIIRGFLTSQFPSMKKVLIDPEATNERAIHVYQKTGFKIIEHHFALDFKDLK